MSKKATIIAFKLNVRNKPTTIGSQILRVLPRDTIVEVEDMPQKADNIIWRRLRNSQEWIAEIDLSTGERFIQLSEISEPEPPPTDPQTWKVVVRRVNIRNVPSLNGDVVRTITFEDEIVLDNNTRHVGEKGWVWRKIVSDENTEEWVAEVNENTGFRLLERVVEREDIDDLVVSSNARVQTQGTQFILDGEPFRFVGANLREFAYYTRSDILPAATANDQDVQITALRQIGMRVVRLFAPHHRIDTATSIQLLKNALDKLHQANLLAIVTLTDALGVSGYNITEDRVRFHNQILGHVNKTTYFHEEGYRLFYLPFVERVVQSLRDHPAIFAWEIGNEFAIHPQPANSNDGNAFLAFHDTVSRRIRQLDPNHLITTGLVNTGHGTPAFHNAEDYARRLYSIPSIDFATVHFYQHMNNPNAAMADEEGRSLVDFRVVKSLGKPIIVEEFGSAIGNHNRVNFTAMKLNAWISSGAAGFMQWGFSATGRDIGVGDNQFGMDNYSSANTPIFDALVRLYRDWAKNLANG